MESVLANPLIAFVIMLVAAGALYGLLSRLRLGKRGKGERGLGPYSCGEELPTHMIQPDYGQFYPFAFFFTILHVVALMATTIPGAAGITLATVLLVTLYVICAIVGLTILYRK